MQEVQTFIRLTPPLIEARTVWMFGIHRRFVRRWEWLIVFPTWGFRPQTSHI